MEGAGGRSGGLQTLSGDLERKLLSQDLAKEHESDEDGGPRARFELDSDFSLSEEEENPNPDEQVVDDGKENWSEILTKTRAKHNTGPKGVRADYNEARHIMRRRNETKRMQDEEAFKRAAYGSKLNGESVSFSSNAKGLAGSHLQKYDADEEDNSAGSDSDDEEFLAAYREQRLRKLQGFTQLPQFGRVIYVEKFGFLDEVDNADPRTFVVTHIYEEYIAACRKMNTVLDQFAAKHPHVKVLKLVATDASQTLSHRALPAFLVYKDKELVSDSAIGVNEHEFGTGDFGVPDVEWFLSTRYGIELSGVDVSEGERAQAASAAVESADQLDVVNAWSASAKPSLGSVNLLGQRLGKHLSVTNDDDDW
mmetsp:Transcript_19100/g.48297  ORF Transcript_19100/g.48297 Transcript_19100/m.48297 type:complete len:366 (-) Transcript_19100:68-1165(-)